MIFTLNPVKEKAHIPLNTIGKKGYVGCFEYSNDYKNLTKVLKEING